MSLRLAKRVAQLKTSASIASKKKVTELQAAGRNIVDLTLGEPDIDTPTHIIDAAIAAMRRGETHYTATPGTPALRAAITRKFKRENGLSYQLDQVVVGCGSKQIIFDALAATLEEGDEVIVPAPYWVSYPDMVELNGAKAIIVVGGKDVAYKLTPAALEHAITERTRWLILNSPNNPSGAVYSREEIVGIVEVLKRHPQVWVMNDDIYEHLIYDGQRHVNPVQVDPTLIERTLVVNGLSKAHAMTGWRVGYAAGPKVLIDSIGKLLGQSTTCANSISQAAAVVALDGDQAHVRDAVALYKTRRDRMVELLTGVPGMSVSMPAGAFYLYPSVAGMIGKMTPAGKALKTDLDVTHYLLEDANVAVLDGTAFGLSPYIRLSFAASIAIIEDGCSKIRLAAEALR